MWYSKREPSSFVLITGCQTRLRGSVFNNYKPPQRMPGQEGRKRGKNHKNECMKLGFITTVASRGAIGILWESSRKREDAKSTKTSCGRKDVLG